MIVVVVPCTVRSPAIVTSFGNPIVTVPELSPTVTSPDVPLNVSVSFNAMSVVFEPSLTVK